MKIVVSTPLKIIFYLKCLFFLVIPIVNAQPCVQIKDIELPKIIEGEQIIKHLAYTLSYNEKHEQANWVAYELTADETKKTFERSNDFRPDEDIATGSATNADYEKSGYDRGHLAPAADMSWSEEAMKESFYFSNMSPQVPEFNRGIWKKLEGLVRQWAIDNQKIYVVTGPVLTDSLLTIGIDKVSVPKYFYKVILDYNLPEIKGIGFILPNAASNLPLYDYAVSIDSVEHFTGIDFYPALPDKVEDEIEAERNFDCWTWKTESNNTNASSNTSLKHVQAKIQRAVQCKAITKEGKRCKRMTTNKSGYCPIHKKEIKKP